MTDLVRGICLLAIAAALLGVSAAYAPVAAEWRHDEDFEWDWKETYQRPYEKATTRTFVSKAHNIKPMLSANSVRDLQQAIARYEIIVNQGGWPKLPAHRALSTGSRGRDVVLLRKRLELSGDIKAGESADPEEFDIKLDAALRRFQKRLGLKDDGVAGGRTLEALNVSASERLAALRANLRRVKKLSQNLGDRYVVVNIPAAQAETVENGFVHSRHNVIAGMPERPTPVVASRIREINFNPYWHVPFSIVKKDLLPAVRKDRTLLRRMKMQVFRGGYNGKEIDPNTIDWGSVKAGDYVYRQEPGRYNAMASVKINFPNSHAVYLHDTPTKRLFGQAERFFSSGCVRVEGVQIMVKWLLEGESRWNGRRVETVSASTERVDVHLSRPVPVRLIYLTAWASGDGRAHFRNDLYGWDEKYQGNEPVDFNGRSRHEDKVAAKSSSETLADGDEPARRQTARARNTGAAAESPTDSFEEDYELFGRYR